MYSFVLPFIFALKQSRTGNLDVLALQFPEAAQSGVSGSASPRTPGLPKVGNHCAKAWDLSRFTGTYLDLYQTMFEL